MFRIDLSGDPEEEEHELEVTLRSTANTRLETDPVPPEPPNDEPLGE